MPGEPCNSSEKEDRAELSAAVEQRNIRVVGGIYRLESGRVDMVS